MKSSIFLISMLCCGACSSFLVPLTYNFQNDNNTSLLSEYDSVTVIAQNIEMKGGYLVFDVEVNNRSDQPIEVIPEHMCYYASPAEFRTVDSTEDVYAATLYYQNEFNYKENAMRPKEVAAFFKDRFNAKQGVGIALLLVGAGLVIHDVAKDVEDAGKTEWTAADAKKAYKRDVLTASSLTAIDVANESLAAAAYKDDMESRFLPDELFPQTTLAPGNSFRGKVFFRKKENKPYYRLVIPIGNTDYFFDFRKPISEEKLILKGLRRN